MINEVKDAAPRKLTVFKFAMLAFLSAAAAPFGAEDAVRSGGAFVFLVALVVMPFVYILPASLVTMELASWMPTNEGSILWVHRAFGTFPGFINGALGVTGCLVDIAVYPVLFSNYLKALTPLAWHQVLLCRFAVIIVGTTLALLSAARLGDASAIITFIVCIPLVVGLFAAPSNLLPNESWLQLSPTVHWGSTIATILWMYCGVDQFSFLAGELENPHVYRVGMIWVAIMETLVYGLPVIVCLPLHGDWSDGYLANGYNALLPGLGTVVGAVAALSAFGLYMSNLMLYSRNVWAFSRLGWLPKVLQKTSEGTNAPYVCIGLHAFFAVILSFVSFDFIMMLEAAIGSYNYILQYMCFIKFRYMYPVKEHPRPITVGGGKLVAWAIITPPVILWTAVTVACLDESWWIVFLSSATLLGLTVAYFVMRRCGRNISKKFDEFCSSSVELSPLSEMT